MICRRGSYPRSEIYRIMTRCRRVSPEDVQACEEKYNKSKMVHSILRHVAETTASCDLTELYEVFTFYLTLTEIYVVIAPRLATLPVIWTRV